MNSKTSCIVYFGFWASQLARGALALLTILKLQGNQIGDPGLSSLSEALASGAQWVSTDYPVAADSGYVVALPGVAAGSPARCNPVSAPASCTELELQE